MDEKRNSKVIKYLESIGKNKFVEYYESFKNGTFVSDCKETIKSKKMRQRFANYLFVNKLVFYTLEICSNSRISLKNKEKAKRIINELSNVAPLSNDFINFLDYDQYLQRPDEYLLHLLSKIFIELRNRGMIRGKNLVGDLAEYYVMEYFNNRDDLPNLTMETQSNKGFDLYDSVNHKRYQVKGVTQSQTSDFNYYGNDGLVCDFIVVVKLDGDFRISEMYLLDAIHFDDVKKRHSEKSYYIRIDSNFKKISTKLV